MLHVLGQEGFNTDTRTTCEQQENLAGFPVSEANEWNADESGGLSVEDMLQDFRSRRSGESDSKCDSERDYMKRRWQEDL